MKRKILAVIMTILLSASMAACGGEETTLTGMVVSLDGTVLSLMELGSVEERGEAGGEMPSMPGNMEDFQGFGGFAGGDFSGFDGTVPEGETAPQWGEGEIPGFPGGMTMPENGEMPDFGGEIPDFSGSMGGMNPGITDLDSNMEATQVDIGDSHISLEIDGVRASGSLEDITPGSFVTVTVDSRGKVTNVLVSSMSGYMGGMGWSSN